MDKTLNFCTLFDSSYLARGLATYLSLKDNCPNFKLYVIAFDQKCLEMLTKLNLPNLVVIGMKEFEDPELLRIKPTRTGREYFWTCSSSSILYTIKKFNLNMCTYIDADLIFFHNPKEILDEMGQSSVLLTEHRLHPGGKKEEMNGKYCVQFMPFKNDALGMEALTWWRDRCIEWCYDRYEDGKLGDQKYLDDWTTRFKGIHVMKHLGGGVAPWNMYRYKIIDKDSELFVKEKLSGKIEPLIFYHYQSTKIFNLPSGIKSVYWPYDPMIDKEANLIYKKHDEYITSAYEIIKKDYPEYSSGLSHTKFYIEYLFRKLAKLPFELARELLK